MTRKVSNIFDSKPGLHHQYIFQLSREYVKNKVVLDIGCWTGQYTKLGARVAKKMYGLDPSSEAISFAKKQIPQANFAVGSATRLPYPKDYFDVVIMSEVLEHVPLNTELKVFMEIRRVLKKGGVLILSTPNNNLFSIILDPAYFILGHRHYSEAIIKHYLTDSHFKIKEIYVLKGFIHLLWANIELVFKYLLHQKPTSPALVNWLLLKEQRSKGFASIYAVGIAE
jgi:ubiquinone/menaquinone biosynthesis C-methylase UbiE